MPPPGTQKPPAYWPLSIVGLLFSFLFGAIAIYFSVQVGRRWNRGDVDGARRASRTARTLGIIAIIVGVIGTAILLAADALRRDRRAQPSSGSSPSGSSGPRCGGTCPPAPRSR